MTYSMLKRWLVRVVKSQQLLAGRGMTGGVLLKFKLVTSGSRERGKET